MTTHTFVDLLGIDRALAVSRRLGGRRIYISNASIPSHGLDADFWAALQTMFRGERVEIPTHTAIQRVAQRQIAAEMILCGENVRNIVKATGLSRRTIMRLRGTAL